MIVGDVVDIKLKRDPTWRRSVEVKKLDQKGVYYTNTSFYPWDNIKHVEVVKEKPDFKNNDRVSVNGKHYMKREDKWWVQTDLTDATLAEIGTITPIVSNLI